MKNIIVVDMQVGFIKENNKHLVEKINNYLKTNKFDNVIYTKYINSQSSPFVKILGWEGLTESSEQELCVTMLENSVIFEKEGYGLSGEQMSKLKELNITEIEVCGTDSDACVMMIAYQLFDNGIKPIILKELCASSSSNGRVNEAAFLIMERSFGKNNIV